MPEEFFLAKARRQTSGIKFILPIRCNNSSSVTLRVPPSAPVSATPTAFAPQIGQFPTGEGWRKSLLSSAHSPYPRPPCIYSGRADNACTNLLGSLARYVRTRGSMRLWGAAKLPIFALSFAARTCHAWLVRLTRARGRRYIRGRKALLYDFWYFWSRKSTIREKFL